MALKAEIEPSAAEKDLRKLREAEERKLPAALVEELTEAFQFFDLNGDGKLSVNEIGTVVRTLGEEIAEEDLRKVISVVDEDGDGCLDLHEFIDLNTRAMSTSSSRNGSGNAMELSSSVENSGTENDTLVCAFNALDIDKDGFISAEELHRVLVGFGDEKFSLEECRSMITCVDEDGDQLVSLHEFQVLMNDNRDLQIQL